MNRIVPSRKLKASIALAVSFLFFSHISFAQTWAGTVSTAWEDPANWSTGVVPTTGSAATIPAAPVGGRFPVISTGTQGVKDFTIQAGASVSQTGGTLQVAHDWKNSGTYNATGGTVQYTANAGSGANFSAGTNNFFHVIVNSGVDPGFNNYAGSTINVAGDFSFNHTSFTDATANVTIVFSGTGNQTLSVATPNVFCANMEVNKPSGTLTQASAIKMGNLTMTAGTFSTSASSYSVTTTGNATFTGGTFLANASTLTVTGTWTSNGGTVSGGACAINTGDFVRNAAVLSAPSGTLSVGGNWTNNVGGTMNIASVTFTGAAKTIGGTVSSAFSTVYIADNASYTMANNNSCTSLTFLVSANNSSLTQATGTTFTVNGDATINQPSASKIVAWNINAGTVNVTGNLNLGGNTASTGRVAKIVLTTGTLNISGNLVFNAAATTAQTAVIDNSGGAGTVTLGGSLVLTNGAGTVTPGATGIFVYNGSGSQTVQDASAIQYNTLVVDKPSGTLSLLGNMVVGGDFRMERGSFNTGNYSFSASNYYLNGGTLAAGSSTITVNGSWLNNGTNVTSSGTINFSGSSSIGGTYSTAFGNLVIKNGASTTMSNNNSCQSFTIEGAIASATSFTHSGTAALTVNGAATLSQPPAGATYTWNIGAGSATVSGLLLFNGAATNSNRIAKIILTTGTLNAFGGLTMTASYNTTKVIDVSGGAATINLKGALSAPANSGTYTTGSGNSIFNYADNVNAQTVEFFAVGNYENLHFNNTSAGGATLSAALTATNVTGNIRVQSGTMSNGGYAIALASGKTFQVADGATFLLMAGTGMVTGTGITKTFGATSTVNYAGTAQTVSSESYGHLTLSGSGTKTMPAASMTLAGNYTMSGTATATAAGAMTIGGNVTLGSGTTFGFGAYTHTVAGNWTNNGATVTAGTSTITLNGTADQTLGGTVSTLTWYNAIVNKASGKVTLSTNLTVGGALTFTRGSIQTNTYSVILPAGASIVGAGQATGWVNGNLQRNFTTSVLAQTFDVGGATYYTPATVTFASVSTGGNILVNGAANSHANSATSSLGQIIPRVWTVTNTGGVVYTSYTISLTWNAAQNYAGFDATTLSSRLYSNAAWATPTTSGTPTATNFQAAGVQSFGDFLVGRSCALGTWAGTVSNDWSNGANWGCSLTPTSTTNVIIPSGVTLYPIIASGQNNFTNNLTIQSGAALTVLNATLKISGAITNQGSFDAGTGATVYFTGTSAQTLPASVFANNTVYDLVDSNAVSLTVQGALNVTNVLSVYAGTLYTNGYVTLKSTATNTARVDRIKSAAATPIVGDVTVERYIPGRRKYRLMAPSVTTSSKTSLVAGEESLSIWGSWQNSGVATSGVGTLITGGSASDGFDTQTTSSSLYTYNETTRKFVGFNTANGKNTKYTPLKTGQAYYMFVYGDRLNTISAANPNPTVLKTKGTLATGTQVFTAATATPLSATVGNYALIGNPYACPIDWKTVQKANVSSTIWGWDANLSSTGGYVTVTATATGAIVAPISPLVQVSRYVQPGQGFFIQTTAANPQVIMNESDKVATTTVINNNVFRSAATAKTTGANVQPLMAINLLYTSAGSPVLADGAVAAFDAAYTTGITDEDGLKMVNNAESVSLSENGTLLSINSRPVPQNNDTLYLNLAKMTKAQYTLEIFAQDMSGIVAATPFLQDAYLNTVTPLSVTDTNRIAFNIVGTDPASYSPTRFMVVFKQLATLPATFVSVAATRKERGVAVEWKMAAETGIKKYAIERSDDGQRFEKIEDVAVNATGSGETYRWLDASPLAGNNWYRIRAMETDDKGLYSQAVRVVMNIDKASFVVAPNPIRNQQINLQVKDLDSCELTAYLFDQKGNEVLKQAIDHKSGSATYVLVPRVRLAAGLYFLKLLNHKKEEQSLMIRVE